MAPPASLHADLQAFRAEVEKHNKQLHSDHQTFVLSTWIQPGSDDEETSAMKTFPALVEDLNGFMWSRMEVYEAKYDDADGSCGASCQCKAFLDASEPIVKKAAEEFNKNMQGFRLSNIKGRDGYYALPADSDLSDAAKGDVKTVRDKLETIFRAYRKEMHSTMLRTAQGQKSAISSLDSSLNTALKEVLAEAIQMKEDRKSDEFVYLLANQIKQVRDRHKAEWCAFHDSD